MTSARLASKHAAIVRGADFFVLALGLGLAAIPDIEDIAGENAALTAGMGVTVAMPFDSLGLDHVIMDDTDLGYLIPQRNQVIGGGTNEPFAYDDPEAQLSEPTEEQIRIVREKIEYLWPPAAGVHGVPRVAARPLRAGGELLIEVLDNSTLWIPGVVAGGAGGSGWTFSVGMADDIVRKIAEVFGRSSPVPLLDVSGLAIPATHEAHA